MEERPRWFDQVDGEKRIIFDLDEFNSCLSFNRDINSNYVARLADGGQFCFRYLIDVRKSHSRSLNYIKNRDLIQIVIVKRVHITESQNHCKNISWYIWGENTVLGTGFIYCNSTAFGWEDFTQKVAITVKVNDLPEFFRGNVIKCPSNANILKSNYTGSVICTWKVQYSSLDRESL